MYNVYFNTGAGDYKSEKNLEELMLEINEDLAYTQQSVRIEDENGNIVARLPWWGVKASEEDVVTADFGDFGFYGEWILGE